MTTETARKRDLRTPIAHDPLVPYAVVDGAGRVRAKFAYDDQAVSYAADLSPAGAVVVDTTPLSPPVAPGWYESAHAPLNLPFAENRPVQLGYDGVWRTPAGDAIEAGKVGALMPLTRLGAQL